MKKHLLMLSILALLISSTLVPISLGGNTNNSKVQPTIESYNRYNFPEYYDSYNVDEISENIRPCISNNDEVIQDISNKEESQSSEPLDGPMDSAWPMFQHDARHTGRSPYGVDGTPGVEKWRVNIGSWAYSSPVIDKNGTIYIGSWELNAIYPNGTKKWSFKTNGPVQSSPAIAADGTIYFGSDDGRLYAVYPNGTKKWSLGIGSSWVYSSPVIDEEGIIYVASVGGNICAVYPNGTKKWDFGTGGYVYCSPALDNEGTVYCGSYDGYMYAIYTSNGTLKWRFNTGDWIAGLAIGNDGTIYFGDSFRSLYALYSNGTKKWHRDDLGLYIASSPAIAEDGTIFVTTTRTPFWGGYLYSITPDGAINWKYFIDTEPISASPVIDKYGIIYFGGQDGIFYAFNPDGTLRWDYKSLDFILDSAAIAEDGTIYFGATFTSEPDFYANLYAIEVLDNQAPEKPNIDGPVNGKILTRYTYTAVTTDPDGDDVSYFFDWGDETPTVWTRFVPSGTSRSRSHTWLKEGTYTVKVKAKDVHGAESQWATLQVTMPRNKIIESSLLLRFFEQFPLLQKLLLLIE